MPSVKLSQLLSAGTLLGNEILAVVVPGSPNQSRKTTLAGIATYLGKSATSSTPAAAAITTPSIVQVGPITGNTPNLVTLNTKPTPGNLIVVAAGCHDFRQTVDGFARRAAYSVNDEAVAFYTKVATVDDTNQFTVSGWGDNGIMVAYELAGVDPFAIEQSNAISSGVNPGTSKGPKISPSRKNSVTIVIFGNSSGVSVQSMSAGFTLDAQGLPANHGAAIASGIFNGYASYTPQATGALFGEDTVICALTFYAGPAGL